MSITSLNISDGTVSRKRIPRIRQRYLYAGLVLILLIIALVAAYYNGLFTNESQSSKAIPNPTKPLPPSPSILRRFRKAAVCVDSKLCAEIGKKILEENGTAVDATLAAMFCNGITTMQSMGLGGGFLMTIYIHEERKAYSLNAREKAPAKATEELYRTDPSRSKSGPLATAVPGELRGYWTAHQRFGRLPWRRLIEPTIELCEQGFPMSHHQHSSLFKADIRNDTNLKQWFKDDKGHFKPLGSKIIPTKLCNTLKIIADKGADDFYNGSIADIVVEDIAEMGGIITKEDLQNYTAEWIDPIRVKFRNANELYTIPLPGSGVLLAFILKVLEGYNFTRNSIDGIDNTVKTYHRTIEAFKYAYAKRTELGDTAFINITQLIKNLTSDEYAESIRLKINDTTTSQNPIDYGAVLYAREDKGTAHVSVLTENGDAVSVTSSLNTYFGSGRTSRRTGILLNSVMDDFSYPFFDSYFGIPGSPNNAMVPGKRPLSSMSPSILVDADGAVKVVVGASGGTKITTAVAQVLMRLLWFEQNLKEAVDAPRIHHQLFPMEAVLDYGTLQQIFDGLRAFGHKTTVGDPSMSVVCAILKQAVGVIFGNADYRKGGDVYGID